MESELQPPEAESAASPALEDEETACHATAEEVPFCESMEPDLQQPPEYMESKVQQLPESVESDLQQPPEYMESKVQQPPESVESDLQEPPESAVNTTSEDAEGAGQAIVEEVPFCEAKESDVQPLESAVDTTLDDAEGAGQATAEEVPLCESKESDPQPPESAVDAISTVEDAERADQAVAKEVALCEPMVSDLQPPESAIITASADAEKVVQVTPKQVPPCESMETALQPPESAVYMTLEDAERACQATAKEHGYAVVRKRSKSNSLGIAKVWLACSKGRFRKSSASVRKSSTPKTGCLFEAQITRLDPEMTWRVHVIKPMHNHTANLSPITQPQHRKISSATSMRIRELSDQTPKETLKILLDENPELLLTRQDIRNERKRIRTEELDSGNSA